MLTTARTPGTAKALGDSNPHNGTKRVGNLGKGTYKLIEVTFCSQKLTALYLQGTEKIVGDCQLGVMGVGGSSSSSCARAAAAVAAARILTLA